MLRHVAAMVVLLTCCIAGAAPTTRPMVVYDSLLSYKDKPDTAKLGMKPIYVADREFWKNGDMSEKADTSAPDETACRALGARVAAMHCPLVVDIEHWQCDLRAGPSAAAEVDQIIEKFTHIVRWCRAGANGDLTIGFYGVPPIGDYWTVIKNKPEELESGRQANAKWADFAGQVDFIFPSLYTYYGSDYFDGTGDYRGDWVKFAKANIEQAKQYHKPVIGFLWPRYHSSNAKLKETFLDAEYFHLELQTCRDAGIDVVIWDWSGFDNFKPFDWKAQGTWWDELRKVLSAPSPR